MLVLRSTYDDLAAKQARTDAALLAERRANEVLYDRLTETQGQLAQERARAMAAEARLVDLAVASLTPVPAPKPAVAVEAEPELSEVTANVRDACKQYAFGVRGQEGRNLSHAYAMARQGATEHAILAALKRGERVEADA